MKKRVLLITLPLLSFVLPTGIKYKKQTGVSFTNFTSRKANVVRFHVFRKKLLDNLQPGWQMHDRMLCS